MRARTYYVYIASSPSQALYVGVTNNLERRAYEHAFKVNQGFTAKYHVTKLVHLEEYSDIRDAIAREKEIKGWRRNRKIWLIESTNPKWVDLLDDGS